MNTDAVLLQQARAGNKEAFGELILRHQKQVYRLAYRILSNAADAADIAQEAFLKAYKNLQSLKDPNKFAQWLMRIATNECYSWIRRRQDNLMSVEEELLCRSLLRCPPAPDEILIKRELYQRIMTAIAELPELERKVIQMYYLEGNSYKDIQAELSITKGTLGRRLHQARTKLRRKLQAACQGIAAFLSGGFNRVGKIGAVKPTTSTIALPTVKYLVVSLLIHLTLFTTTTLFDGLWKWPPGGGEHFEEGFITVASLSSLSAPGSLSPPSSSVSATMKHLSQHANSKSPSASEEINRFSLPMPKQVSIPVLNERMKMETASSLAPLLSSTSDYFNSPASGSTIQPFLTYSLIQAATSETKRTQFMRGFQGQMDSAAPFDVNAQTEISPNDGVIAEVASADEPALTLKGHKTQVTKIAFSPDGRLLASASRDNTIRLWNVETGEGNILPLHHSAYPNLVFSPDGKWLASSSTGSEQILLWGISEEETIEIPAFNNISDLCFNPDGTLLIAVSGMFGRLLFWDITSEMEINPPFKMMRGYSAVAFSPDGKLLALSNYAEIDLWNLVEGRLAIRLSGSDPGPFYISYVNALQFSPDGQLLATSDNRGNVTLWDVESGQMKRSLAELDYLRDFNWKWRGIAFNPDGSLFASGGWPVKLRDTVTWQIMRTFRSSQPVAFSPDGKWFATTQDDNILLWRIDFSEREAPHERVTPAKIAFISDRDADKKFKNNIYLMATDGSRSVKLATPPEGNKNVGGVSISPDDKRIAFHAIDSSKNADIWVMDVDGENPKRLTFNRNASNPTWSPDGGRIAFEAGIPPRTSIYVMNADGTNIIKLTNNSVDNKEPAWSPDGKKIIFSAKQKRGRIRNLRNLYLIHPEKGQTLKLTNNTKTGQQSSQPAWSPDGKHIAYIYDNDLFLMSAGGKNQRKLASGAQQPAWSPDGAEIAFVYGDDIYAVDVDGKSLMKLTHNKGKDSEPSWFVP